MHVTAVVVARGSIQSSQHLQTNNGPSTKFLVTITPQMANRYCIIVYYIDQCEGGNHVISDFTCAETDKTCSNEVELVVRICKQLPNGCPLDLSRDFE